MGIGNILGLYGFLVLIPFILIYLFKPKPIDKAIPSLMFFIREQKQKKEFSFLKRLLTNLLFLLQLFAILALASSLIEPFITVTEDAKSGNTVLIIDSSASMQTKNNGNTRFELALSEAKKRMHGKISIVLASLTPTITLENGLQSEASKHLSTVIPKEASTNIKGSMDLADALLEKTKGNVVVLSDFITTMENDDPIISKRLLNSRGNSVEFVNLASKANNLGFVDLNIQKDFTEAYIKNFNEEEKAITISLIKNKETITKKDLTINPRSKEKIVFETLPGLSTLKISPDDDLKVDNIVYLSSPLKDNINILLITNTIPKALKNALEAAKYITVEIAEPPIIPDIDHDVVIVSNVNKDELLPGTFNDIKRYVEKGGNLIITSQEGIAQLDTLDLLPVNIIGMGEQSNTIISSQNEITKDIEFGVVKRYIVATPFKDAMSFLNTEDESSLIAYKSYQNGKIIYYGLFDDENDFKFSPDYPIFWNNLINFMLDTEDINDYNFKIGERTLVDKAGFYKEDSKQVAYNLLDEAESEVSKDPLLFSKEYSDFVEKNVKENIDKDLTMILLILACLILIFEVAYIKFRGDL
ncbi:hypothetical protein CEE44_05045 [Candidatus Woesearchaeota archaeon B3_Woes]|nr:MAG: hypothetical protein CEE44_05045 [Candidatus Woesearchaeota archaeon B3_Woes]